MSLLSYFKKVKAVPKSTQDTIHSPDHNKSGDSEVRKRTLTAPLSNQSHSGEGMRTPISTYKRKRSRLFSEPVSPNSSVEPAMKRSSPEGPNSDGRFPHDKLKWLQKDHLKDKSGKAWSHDDYNPRSLQVPPDYFKRLTPGLQQWWNIKAENFDSVIMFKVGKFYELYHMDAVVGVRELSLVFMKSDFAHCGFPEVAFGRYSEVLVEKGYKVARVEQTETVAMMEHRLKQLGASPRSDRVVRREVCSVVTRGTRTLNVLDGTSEGHSLFLLAVKERALPGQHGAKTYGVCFVDTCVGTFHLGQFEDDEQSSWLRTLLAHYPPAHFLHERHGVGVQTTSVMNQLLPNNIKEALVPNMEFWTADKTLQVLTENGYFRRAGEEDGSESQTFWPPTLQAMMDDSLGLCVKSNYELAVSALGACTWCLSRAHKDYSIISLAKFKLYDPLDAALSEVEGARSNIGSGRTLVLDDITLANLDIMGVSGPESGTLLEKLDHTVTAFGKRLLRRWVCAPLVEVTAIVSRQEAVQQFQLHPTLMEQARAVLARCPDLERLLRKIHNAGCEMSDNNHPDSRAVFFEHALYSKRKIAGFMSVLDGLRLSTKLLDVFKPHLSQLRSTLLCELVSVDGGLFPDIQKLLQFFDTSFDQLQAKEAGLIVPSRGVNLAYDHAEQRVRAVEQELDQYLQEQRRELHCQGVAYWGTGRNRFQLEVPVQTVAHERMDSKYELTSQKKGFRRYRTAAIDLLLERLMSAEEARDAALRETMANLFCSFDKHFCVWVDVVQCLSELDVLMSLATYSGSASETMCQPRFFDPLAGDGLPFLLLEDGRHPCVTLTHGGGDFIPNSLTLSGQRQCLVVTGPNMGGKSTLLRLTGLLVVLAQLGCHVPATRFELTPVDRVFTRMGASDRIMDKESTFFVELKETASILRHVSARSLVLVDELGRGTATYDGAAVASAVLKQLAEVMRCRTLFSTHYHFLMDQFMGSPYVQLGHMACMVESAGQEEMITFLYKLVDGICPKSYGFNVACLAGLPRLVVAVAREKACAYERDSKQIRTLRKLLKSDVTMTELRRFHELLKC